MTRVAVVTGAAGGIGVATCDLLEEEGWDVVGVDRVQVDRPGALQLDLADVERLVPELEALPQVDALVNNGAMQHFRSLEETTLEEWDAVQAVNLRGSFACLKATQDRLIAAQGAVVNVASVHAVATSRSIAAYAASKGGLLAFTRAAALELAPRGVRVNAVLPGAVDTPALRDGLARTGNAREAERTLIERTPLRRIGAPTDIAHAVSFLVDRRRSAFMTGQALVVDGGALARLGTES
jgi:NAD(P)-dependent dehydrogenase (short-subunit alcohol dehydrogenase family)